MTGCNKHQGKDKMLKTDIDFSKLNLEYDE